MSLLNSLYFLRHLKDTRNFPSFNKSLTNENLISKNMGESIRTICQYYKKKKKSGTIKDPKVSVPNTTTQNKDVKERWES